MMEEQALRLSNLVHRVENSRTKKTNVSIPAEALLRVARGFACIFWGIPLSLWLLSRAQDVRLVSSIRLPAYVVGVFLMCLGAVFLQRAGSLSDRWASRARQALFLFLVEVYLRSFCFLVATDADGPLLCRQHVGACSLRGVGTFRDQSAGGRGLQTASR